MSLQKLELEYFEKSNWIVQENANTNDSAITLFWHVAKEIITNEAFKQLPPESMKAHFDGWIHINKLRDGGWYLPYCGGFSTERILAKGLITPSIISKPPKHLDSAVDQLANFIMIAAQERTGAVGLNAVDLYLAPFVKIDNLSYKQVKQCIQRLIFNLNYTTRVGYQTPFSNVMFGLGIKEYYDMPAYVGGKVVGKLGDYLDEAKIILKAFIDVYLEGDAYGRPFTFPIPTVAFTSEFVKLLESDAELSELFWKCVAERGQFYFLNGYAIDVSGIFSFCCRLTSNMVKVSQYLHSTKGVWVLPPSTGSIGFVTINLPRIAMEASLRGDAEKYLDEILYHYMQLSRIVLQTLRLRYMKLHRLGYYPLTKIYVDEFNPFKYYYNTIAVTGMAEMISIIMNEPMLWYREIDIDGHEYVNDVIRIYREVFEYMNKILEEFEREDNVLYNLEEAPAESSSVRLAKLDWQRYAGFRNFIPRSKDLFASVEEVFYTNQLTPPYTTYRLDTQLEIEGSCQRLFTGGVMKHIFVHRPVDYENVEKLILLTSKYSLVYFSYTPTQSICLNCGYRTIATLWECPKCGSSNVEVWSRIVGYYRPVRNWNVGRRAEFAVRRDLVF